MLRLILAYSMNFNHVLAFGIFAVKLSKANIASNQARRIVILAMEGKTTPRLKLSPACPTPKRLEIRVNLSNMLTQSFCTLENFVTVFTTKDFFLLLGAAAAERESALQWLETGRVDGPADHKVQNGVSVKGVTEVEMCC